MYLKKIVVITKIVNAIFVHQKMKWKNKNNSNKPKDVLAFKKATKKQIDLSLHSLSPVCLWTLVSFLSLHVLSLFEILSTGFLFLKILYKKCIVKSNRYFMSINEFFLSNVILHITITWLAVFRYIGFSF